MPVIEASPTTSVHCPRPHSPTLQIEKLSQPVTDTITLTFLAKSVEPMTYTLARLEQEPTVENYMKKARENGNALQYEIETHPEMGSFLQQVDFHEGPIPQEKSMSSMKGSGPWWMLYVDKKMANFGMSTQRVAPGQRIDWCYDIKPAEPHSNKLG